MFLCKEKEKKKHLLADKAWEAFKYVSCVFTSFRLKIAPIFIFGCAVGTEGEGEGMMTVR